MKKVVILILGLSTLNGIAQDISFYISSNEYEYTLPVDTSFRQVMLTASALSITPDYYFYPDSISFRFPVNDDTVCYTLVGLRMGTWWMDTGTPILSQINPCSEMDSIYSTSLAIPNDTLLGFTYLDLPGDSISGFDLSLTYEDYLPELTWICFWLKSDNQSNWLNFQPLGVGNIWKFHRSGEFLYDQRWEIFDSLATTDTTFYHVEFQTSGPPDNPITVVDTTIVFITTTNPYKISRFSGGWCNIISDFSPENSVYPSFFQTLLPRGNGNVDFGMYNPGFYGYDLATYGIGLSSGSGDFGWFIDLAGYKIGSEIVGDIGTLVGINEDQFGPDNFFLGNYPNPFNPSTILEYVLPEPSYVELIIYDISGRRVQTLVSRIQSAGGYAMTWDGTGNEGKQVSGGMYFASLRAGQYSRVVKMLLLR